MLCTALVASPQNGYYKVGKHSKTGDQNDQGNEEFTYEEMLQHLEKGGMTEVYKIVHGVQKMERENVMAVHSTITIVYIYKIIKYRTNNQHHIKLIF